MWPALAHPSAAVDTETSSKQRRIEPWPAGAPSEPFRGDLAAAVPLSASRGSGCGCAFFAETRRPIGKTASLVQPGAAGVPCCCCVGSRLSRTEEQRMVLQASAAPNQLSISLALARPSSLRRTRRRSWCGGTSSTDVRSEDFQLHSCLCLSVSLSPFLAFYAAVSSATDLRLSLLRAVPSIALSSQARPNAQ